MSESSAFNKSQITPRSPRKESDKQAVQVKKAPPKYVTNNPKVVCNRCEKPDDKLKVRCGKCGRFWHLSCDGGPVPAEADLTHGKWVCSACRKPEKTSSSQPEDVTRTEITTYSGIIKNKPDYESTRLLPPTSTSQKKDMSKPGSTATKTSEPIVPHSKGTIDAPKNKGAVPKSIQSTQSHIQPQKKGSLPPKSNPVLSVASKSSTSSQASKAHSVALAEQRQIIDDELELQAEQAAFKAEQRLLEARIQAELREDIFRARSEALKKRQVIANSIINDNLESEQPNKDIAISVASSRSEVVDEVAQWVEETRANQEEKRSRAHVVRAKPERPAVGRINDAATVGRQISFINPNVTLDEFLDATLGRTATPSWPTLSAEQARARKVMNSELPEFDGNPAEWPSFIECFVESTNRCGFTEMENLSRLSRSLKGDALASVKTKLTRNNSLSSVMATLKLMFGQPEAVYEALIHRIMHGPEIRSDNLQSIVTFATNIKDLCDSLRNEEMSDYLFNPLLLKDLIAKMPENMIYNWGNHAAELKEQGVPPTIDTLASWVCKQAEIWSSTRKLNFSTTRRTSKPTTNDQAKPVKARIFQGTHEEQGATFKGYCSICMAVGHITVKCSKLAKLTLNDRWSLVRRNKLCVKCLGRHFLRNCGSDYECKTNGCKMPHHPLLHGEIASNNLGQSKDRRPAQTVNSHTSTNSPTQSDEGSNDFIMVHANSSAVKFQIVPIVLANNTGHEVHTYAFLDSGSQVTLMEEKLAKQLLLEGKKDRLRLKWSDKSTRDEVNSRRVQCVIRSADDTEEFTPLKARTVHELVLPKQTIMAESLSKYTHMQKVPLVGYVDAVPQLLIGLDNYQLIVPRETREGRYDEPVAVKTRLGWTMYGNIDTVDVVSENMVNCHESSDIVLKKLVENYFCLENIGIKAPKGEVEPREDRIARHKMHSDLRQREDGRYEVRLLWKDTDVILPDSRPMAMSRWYQLERQMNKTGTWNNFNEIIQEYHDRGFMVDITEDEQQHNNKIWYLPLFTVENPNKPGKIRLVWDAAAETNGVSLNSKLLTGPDMLTNLPGVLYKFRERPVAVGGDIERMFHQVLIDEKDQDVQRCVWRRNRNEGLRVSKMKVMIFGAACSPALAQYVKNTHARKYENQYPRAVNAITERHYVDDYLDSFDNVDEAKAVIKQVVQIHQAGGFNLRGLVSNHKDVVNDVSHDEKLLSSEEDDEVKVLGMWWDIQQDCIKYRVNKDRIGDKILGCNSNPTKREILRTLMMVFDPLGLLGFLILKGKLVLKEVWRRGTNWDEPIHEEEFTKWRNWLHHLLMVPKVYIPRCYFTTSECNGYELHTFVDAGEEAAAAIAYLVRVEGYEREAALIGSKTKLGPTKPTSIPRLELQAAVIGSRLADSVKIQHTLPIVKRYFWTDSRNVLCWIRSPKRFKLFVAHRIGEIRENTLVTEWKYVPTKLNPADYGTKWFNHQDPLPELWLKGPPFLAKNEEMWPEEPANLPEIDENDMELRCHLITTERDQELSPEMERFSNWNRLVRCQAQVLRFFYWGKNKLHNKPRDKGPLDVNEIREAEVYLFRQVQLEAYGEEIAVLKQNGVLNKNHRLRVYSPFLDMEGVVRMRSRLEEAEYLTFEQRCPVILPKKHHATDLIIRKYHEEYHHQNHSSVLNQIKQRFMIPALRAALRSLRSRCWQCRKGRLQPDCPEMSPLPRSRLAIRIRPFTYTGVDYFGPILTKRGRTIEKKWGALFTCLTTRAIHLELAASLSTDAFLLVFRRFIARRGPPAEIYSDNGTNFKGADSALQKLVEQHCKDATSEKYFSVKWHFNPPHAPHMGGAWERLVKSVKSALSAIQLERVPSEDLLRTILTECEMLVNSRPLTYVDLDENSLEALTPNHFLLGSSTGIKPIGNFTDDPEVLRTEWKRQQVVIGVFWKRFLVEYLPSIAQRTKWYDRVQPLEIGDVVALADSNQPGSWKLGRIISVITSKDGGVRQAEVKTANGVYKRPASKLAVLVRELRDKDTSSAGGGVKN